jgi:hypothetical protein
MFKKSGFNFPQIIMSTISAVFQVWIFSGWLKSSEQKSPSLFFNYCKVNFNLTHSIALLTPKGAIHRADFPFRGLRGERRN